VARKVRFGVSLDSSIAEALDEVAVRLRSTRSRIVEQALASFLSESLHGSNDHYCAGVIVARGSTSISSEVLERFREVVRSHSHVHLAGGCVDLIVVEGSYGVISSLLSTLCSLGLLARYLPLHGVEEGGGGTLKYGDGGA
jgi:metal-responsive CopG/Arc/MetJ family transcriptional regulator